jgi:hypothetical protein
MMTGLMSDQNGDARKYAYEEKKDCDEPLSVFGENPVNRPMHLTQAMARLLSPVSGQGPMPASGVRAVFSITHPAHQEKHSGSNLMTACEIQVKRRKKCFLCCW